MLGKGLGAVHLRFPFNTGVFTISKHTISVSNRNGSAVLFSDPPLKAGCRAGFTDSMVGMARAGPSRSIGPLPGGNKFLKLISGSKFLAPSIHIRYRPNFAVPVSEMCNVMQLANRAHTRVSPSALVNQPPLHTHPALDRRLD